MDPHRSKAIDFWNATSDGAAGANVLTKAAEAGKRHTVTHIAGSGDAAATVTLEFGATVVWQKTFGGAFTFSETLPPGEYTAAVNQAVILRISAATADSKADMAGYDIPG